MTALIDGVFSVIWDVWLFVGFTLGAYHAIHGALVGDAQVALLGFCVVFLGQMVPR